MDVALIWLGWLAAVATARLLRNRFYATFVGVVLGLCALVWTSLFAGERTWWAWIIFALIAASFAHFALLARPSLRPRWYRVLVSVPVSWFGAASLLAFPWAIVAAFGVEPIGWWIPFALCVLGVVQSVRHPRRDVHIALDGADVGDEVRRVPYAEAGEGRPLRVVQITDPHLGPFMSKERLRAICERAVAADPDLVLVTGDLTTMESHEAVDELSEAFAPLAALPGRVFACMGNHDHEAVATVHEVYRRIGARLLIDEATVAETPWGTVDVVGADFVWREREQHLTELFDRVGTPGERPRLLMLHDPGAFRFVPPGAADLTLSGHTHGGHVGLVALGFDWTIIGASSRLPDHGLWGRAGNRLYVHRGNGHYGYPVRLGVPGEESVLHLWWRGRQQDE